MGGCLGRVNCFSAGRNPDNGRGEESSSREALRQRWRPGQAPAQTTEIRRMTPVSQRGKHPAVGLGAPMLPSVLGPGPGRGQGLREGLAGGTPWGVVSHPSGGLRSDCPGLFSVLNWGPGKGGSRRLGRGGLERAFSTPQTQEFVLRAPKSPK